MSAEVREDRTGTRRWVIIASFLALAVAVFYAAGQQWAGPVVWSDAAGYLSGAQVICEEHTYGLSLVQLNHMTLPDPPEIDRVPWWPPGYSCAIALVSLMRADEPMTMIVATHRLDLVAQLAAAVGFGVLAALGSGRRTAAPIVAGLYLLSGPMMREAPRIASEHLYMALIAWAAVLHLKAVMTGRRGFVAGAAALWSAAVLTRYAGAVAAGAAGLTSLIVLGRTARWRAVIAGLAPAITCWIVMGAWFARNLHVAGRLTQGYAPSPDTLLAQGREVLFAWIVGLCGTPVIPSVIPGWRTMIATVGGVLMVLTLIAVAIGWALAARRQSTDFGWRWTGTFCCIAIALVLGLLVFSGAKARINTAFGRLIMPASALTIVLVVTAACRMRLVRPVMFLLGFWLVGGGLLQGATNLMLPAGRERLGDLAAVGESREMQRAASGRRLLIASADGVRPSADLVAAAVFVPGASTVYWVDDPGYTGITVTAGEIAPLIEHGRVDGLLRGPGERIPRFSPGGHGPQALRRSIHRQLERSKREELEHLRASRFILPVPTTTVAREGAWSIERITDTPGPTPAADESADFSP